LRWVQAGVQAGAVGAAIATGLAEISFRGIGIGWWWFSLLEHFRAQYSLILLMGLVLGFGLPGCPGAIKRWLWLWLVPLTLNVALIAPLLLPAPVSRISPVSGLGAAPLAQGLRLLYITLDHDYADVSQVVAYVQRQQADLVFLLEVTPTSLTALQRQLGEAYRLVLAEPRWNSHGMAWFVPVQSAKSGPPIAAMGAEIIHFPEFSDRPLLKGTISYGEKVIDLLLFHAARPYNAASLAFQTQEFSALAAWIQTVPHPLMVVGDFNSTPWYGPFRQMLSGSGLVNSQVGFGLQTTWHSQWPPLSRLAIDHSLHSRDLITLSREIGPPIGSDHLPLTVDFALRQANASR
jgi:endonuclease/exonuclease/phosphatase (EEP) superfamily protein YafD